MKFLIWPTLAASVVFFLGACGSDSSPSPTDTPGSPSHDAGPTNPSRDGGTDGGSNGGKGQDGGTDGGVSDGGTGTPDAGGGAPDGGASDGGTGTPDAGSDDPIAREWIVAHNNVRKNVTPAPSAPMAGLTWSAKLAEVAQKYTTKCEFKASGGAYGENLSATSGGKPTPTSVVSDWTKQVADYDYNANTCASGKECGNYKQVVWAHSKEIGCGSTECTTNSPFHNDKPWTLWVCSYDPPGNVVGEKPY